MIVLIFFLRHRWHSSSTAATDIEVKWQQAWDTLIQVVWTQEDGNTQLWLEGLGPAPASTLAAPALLCRPWQSHRREGRRAAVCQPLTGLILALFANLYKYFYCILWLNCMRLQPLKITSLFRYPQWKSYIIACRKLQKYLTDCCRLCSSQNKCGERDALFSSNCPVVCINHKVSGGLKFCPNAKCL